MPALHHLALRTADLERLLDFYRSWFGFTLVRDARPRSVWLGLGPSAVLMIEQADASEPRIAPGSRELMAFTMAAAERGPARERLVSAAMLERETEHTLYFRDPDGRCVALSSYPL